MNKRQILDIVQSIQPEHLNQRQLKLRKHFADRNHRPNPGDKYAVIDLDEDRSICPLSPEHLLEKVKEYVRHTYRLNENAEREKRKFVRDMLFKSPSEITERDRRILNRDVVTMKDICPRMDDITEDREELKKYGVDFEGRTKHVFLIQLINPMVGILNTKDGICDCVILVYTQGREGKYLWNLFFTRLETDTCGFQRPPYNRTERHHQFKTLLQDPLLKDKGFVLPN